METGFLLISFVFAAKFLSENILIWREMSHNKAAQRIVNGKLLFRGLVGIVAVHITMHTNIVQIFGWYEIRR